MYVLDVLLSGCSLPRSRAFAACLRFLPNSSQEAALCKSIVLLHAFVILDMTGHVDTFEQAVLGMLQMALRSTGAAKSILACGAFFPNA